MIKATLIKANNGLVTREFVAQKIDGRERIVFKYYDDRRNFLGYKVMDEDGFSREGTALDYQLYWDSFNPRAMPENTLRAS